MLSRLLCEVAQNLNIDPITVNTYSALEERVHIYTVSNTFNL